MSANHSQLLPGGMPLCLSEPDARRGSSGGLSEDRGSLSVVLVLSCGVVIGYLLGRAAETRPQPFNLALSDSIFSRTLSLHFALFCSLILRILLSGQGRILGGGYLGLGLGHGTPGDRDAELFHLSVDDLLVRLLDLRDDGHRARLDGLGERLEDAVRLDGPVLIDRGADKPPARGPEQHSRK
jgi:hypothetical protein